MSTTTSSKSTTLHQIVFSSCVQVEPTEAELLALLHGSRQRNACRGITGLLLYHAGQVLVVLEGAAGAVREVYDNLRADVRYRNPLLLSDGPVQCRTFPDWRLGFVLTPPAGPGPLPPGYVDPRQPNFLHYLAPGASPHLLRLLREFGTVEADTNDPC